MQKNDLIKYDGNILRVLSIKDDMLLVIDCLKRSMPYWFTPAAECSRIDQNDLYIACNMDCPDIDKLDSKSRRIAYERYTLIAGILPFIADLKQRSRVIAQIADDKGISAQTIRSYLCLYLAFQNIAILAPKPKAKDKELTKDQKNMRWALNKFFYTRNKNSLKDAYSFMLKEKYCDSEGRLLKDYPTYNQFRYYYRTHKKLQTYYISRDGIKSYERNNRPLLGDGIRAIAPNVGTAMIDSTTCDIYLIDEAGNLVGRPILTACVDVYSTLCYGFAITWEGGMYSLKAMLSNVLADKVDYCKKLGIDIKRTDWDSTKLPAAFISDMGSEYKSANFEQITELGVTIINLASYRPELKGAIEKFFDVIQGIYKKHLIGKGVIMPDFQERGAHDYRRDACLTLVDFEKIIARCVVYYNTQRLISNFPYTEDMIKSNIRPYANELFNYGLQQDGATLIDVDSEQVMLTLLPRTIGKFTRQGLIVNKMRYKHEHFVEQFLAGGEVEVAYNPDDVSFVWLIDDGLFIRFTLIQAQYKGKKLTEVNTITEDTKAIVGANKSDKWQAEIDIANYIETIASSATKHKDTNIKGVRQTRKKETSRTHVDYLNEVN